MIKLKMCYICIYIYNKIYLITINKRYFTLYLLALLEQEKQRIEELTAGWDDPTAVDWDNEEKDEQEVIRETLEMPSSQPTYKCTALYSYTVSNSVR